MDVSDRPEDRLRRLLVRADDALKAAPSAVDPDAARARVQRALDQARDLLPEVADADERLDLAADVARRIGDLDRAELDTRLRATDGVAPAPTAGVDPARIPPGQRLTAGFPVLHVGRAPATDLTAFRFTVTGRVHERLRLTWDQLRALPATTLTRDFHCVTGWSRLDNTWTGVRVADLVERAGVRDEVSHAIVSGHPAYSADLPIDVLLADDVLLAWDHDGAPLTVEHGGPLRLVVPALYGWKSVKWATEIRLVDRPVRGYWEERGYHDLGDPWREQRFRGDDQPPAGEAWSR